MLSILLAFPVLFLGTFLQIGVISRLPIGNGIADILLVILAIWAIRSKPYESFIWALIAGSFLTFVSATPFPVYLFCSFFTVMAASYLRRRILQSPLLATLLVVMTSSIFYGISNIGLMFVLRTNFELLVVLERFIIPSMILNLLLCLLLFPFLNDLSRWVHGDEIYE